MHSDIRKFSLAEKCPEKWRPYFYLARLDRPVGWWLLLLPGLWAIMLAPGGWGAKLGLSVLFFIGAVVMRAAGCVINDIWDRDFDAQVERTALRPLASGQVSLKHASIFLGVLLFMGLAILVQMNGATILLGFAVMPLIILYPMMKRITYWPQAFLGLTFNFGALMGWCAMTGSLAPEAFWLYVSGIFWTLGYDTIYAHQDKDDDALVGIKSTALKFGKTSKLWVSGFYALAYICLFKAVLSADMPLYALSIMGIPAFHFIYQIREWRMDDPQSSLAMFQSNRDYGLIVLGIFIFAAI